MQKLRMNNFDGKRELKQKHAGYQLRIEWLKFSYTCLRHFRCRFLLGAERGARARAVLAPYALWGNVADIWPCCDLRQRSGAKFFLFLLLWSISRSRLYKHRTRA